MYVDRYLHSTYWLCEGGGLAFFKGDVEEEESILYIVHTV